MKLNITKPLVVFDLETTGLDLVKDRIIQISYIKIKPDGREIRENIFVNPMRPIPEEVTKLTGITNEMVKDAKPFKEIAAGLANVFTGCDFAGFNSNHFDIPMLAEEFLRAEIDFDFYKARLIDAHSIFCKMERRSLAAAYQFYCERKMEDDFPPHRADNDTEATYRVLMAQLDRYNPETSEDPEKVVHNDMDELAILSKSNDNVDFAGRIVWKNIVDVNGKPILDSEGNPQKQEAFNFGKYKGAFVVDVLHRDPGYYSWMMSSEFTNNTKQVLTRIRMREFMNKKA